MRSCDDRKETAHNDLERVDFTILPTNSAEAIYENKKNTCPRNRIQTDVLKLYVCDVTAMPDCPIRHKCCFTVSPCILIH